MTGDVEHGGVAGVVAVEPILQQRRRCAMEGQPPAGRRRLVHRGLDQGVAEGQLDGRRLGDQPGQQRFVTGIEQAIGGEAGESTGELEVECATEDGAGTEHRQRIARECIEPTPDRLPQTDRLAPVTSSSG